MLIATGILLTLALLVAQAPAPPAESSSSLAPPELHATEVLCIDATTEHRMLGSSVRVLGDVDGDGTLDLALAAVESSFIGAFSGASGEQLWGKSGPWYVRDIARSLVALDDINGDGLPDLAVGYPQKIGDNSNAWSRTWLLSGVDGVELQTLKGDSETVPMGGHGSLWPWRRRSGRSRRRRSPRCLGRCTRWTGGGGQGPRDRVLGGEWS